MRALPRDFDLSALMGQRLEQIRMGTFNLQFHFERDYSIACEGHVVVESNGRYVTVYGESGWADASVLPTLIGHSVTSWKVEGSHEFSLSLSNGAKMRFQSTTGSYEDFVITPGPLVV
jgi:hypothetical protein